MQLLPSREGLGVPVAGAVCEVVCGLLAACPRSDPSPQWMRARWTSDPCYAFFGVDGTECSFLIYLSEVEWFCPPLPWRNQTAARTAPKSLPKVQVSLENRTSSETVGGNLSRPLPRAMEWGSQLCRLRVSRLTSAKSCTGGNLLGRQAGVLRIFRNGLE